MTALTTMFNFVIVYVRYFCTIIFGGRLTPSMFSGEQLEIFENIVETAGFTDGFISLQGVPILQLFIGVFVVGAIIGLAHRLIRG